MNWSNANSGQGALRLDPNETSSWLVNGTTLADFAGVATANNKPSPAFGVLSLQGFSGNSSNWVAQVPEPESYAMMLVGLVLLAGQVMRSRSRSAGCLDSLSMKAAGEPAVFAGRPCSTEEQHRVRARK